MRSQRYKSSTKMAMMRCFVYIPFLVDSFSMEKSRDVFLGFTFPEANTSLNFGRMAGNSGHFCNFSLFVSTFSAVSVSKNAGVRCKKVQLSNQKTEDFGF